MFTTITAVPVDAPVRAVNPWTVKTEEGPLHGVDVIVDDGEQTASVRVSSSDPADALLVAWSAVVPGQRVKTDAEARGKTTQIRVPVLRPAGPPVVK